jgi:F0F1-type ATP synthase membrane subunit b/b'
MENVEPFIGIFAPFFNFALFVVLAVYFFKKPARAAAAKKRADFQALLEEAQKAKLEADARLADLTSRMKNIDSEVAEIKAFAKETAESEAAKILAQAETLSAHLKEEAKRVAAAELDKARITLREEIVAAVSDSVIAKAKSDLNNDGHKSIVGKRIQDLSGLGANV